MQEVPLERANSFSNCGDTLDYLYEISGLNYHIFGCSNESLGLTYHFSGYSYEISGV